MLEYMNPFKSELLMFMFMYCQNGQTTIVTKTNNDDTSSFVVIVMVRMPIEFGSLSHQDGWEIVIGLGYHKIVMQLYEFQFIFKNFAMTNTF